MKAEVKYLHGWTLKIPASGNAPMLFLEWVSNFDSGKMPIQKVINGDTFTIRFHTITKVEIEKCVEYINLNL